MNSFGDSLAAGLILSEQINYGTNRTSVGPKPKTAPKPVEMYKKTHQYPTAPMISAVITDSGIVGNPDVPDYQPTLYGGNMPPALIPLQMNEVGLEIACHINTAFITVQGMWKLHCLRSGRTCDCLLTIPMYEQDTGFGISKLVALLSHKSLVNLISGSVKKEKLTSETSSCVLQLLGDSLTYISLELQRALGACGHSKLDCLQYSAILGLKALLKELRSFLQDKTTLVELFARFFTVFLSSSNLGKMT
eukprot:Gb_09355 [translate_table: standard]